MIPFTYRLRIEPISHVTSHSQRFGSLTDCVANQAKRQSRDEPLPAIRFTYVLRCKVSRTSAHVSSDSRRFGLLTHCVAKGAECQPLVERLPAIRFTYHLR